MEKVVTLNLKDYCRGLEREDGRVCLLEFWPETGEEGEEFRCIPGSLANGYQEKAEMPLVRVRLTESQEIELKCRGCVLNPKGFDKIGHETD